MIARSFLFVFEGSNGVGKTTLAQKAVECINNTGISCDFLSSPGNILGTLGKHIYALHHNKTEVNVNKTDPTSLQALHIGAHIDAIESLIKPRLNSGISVVLDRTWWSTLVYGQVYGANMRSLKLLVEAEKIFWEEVQPDSTFLIRRNKPIDREFTEVWTQITQRYDELFKEEKKNAVNHIVQNDSSLDDALVNILSKMNAITGWDVPVSKLHLQPKNTDE